MPTVCGSQIGEQRTSTARKGISCYSRTYAYRYQASRGIGLENQLAWIPTDSRDERSIYDPNAGATYGCKL